MSFHEWYENGVQWQEYITELLFLKYGEDFQEIPDTDHGDYGLEGYTIDGKCYQCYAVKGCFDNNTLFSRQRDKITTDIKKFMDNRDGLSKIFSNLLISNWFLVVPRWESRRLLEHAGKKTNEVLKANLPYVADNFKVRIITDDAFPKEKESFFFSNPDKIVLKVSDPQDSDIEELAEQKPELINNCIGKLTKLKFNDADTHEYCKNFVFDYLKGQNVLAELLNCYPGIYKKINHIKGQREGYLSYNKMMAKLSNKTGAEIISETFEVYKDQINEIGLANDIIEILAHEALSDWLLRCPLDFPGGLDH
jgi:hypothetical protein